MIPADIRENMSTDSVCTIGIGICNQNVAISGQDILTYRHAYTIVE
jgi:hypothetical protein